MTADRCDCSRRQAVRSLFTGSILFPAVLQQLLADSGDSLAARAPHFPGTAKRVIFMYMPGGVSHVDSFDYKPKLLAAAEAKEKFRNGKLYVRPHWEFKPRGQCGTMVSELFPHVGSSMDDICLIRSMRGDHNDHFQATLGIHTGSVSVARPSIGSWEPRTRICRRSSCSRRSCRIRARRLGLQTFCPAAIPERW